MAKKERKRRFLTIDLNPYMSDIEEARFKAWIEQGIRDMRFAPDNTALTIPKKFLRLSIDNESGNVVVKNKILLTK